MLEKLDREAQVLPAAIVDGSRLYIRLFGSGNTLLAQVQAAHDVLRELPKHAITYTYEHTEVVSTKGTRHSRCVFHINTPWYDGAWPVTGPKGRTITVLADDTVAEHDTEARLWIKAIYAIAELRTSGAVAAPVIHM